MPGPWFANPADGLPVLGSPTKQFCTTTPVDCSTKIAAPSETPPTVHPAIVVLSENWSRKTPLVVPITLRSALSTPTLQLAIVAEYP